MKTPIFFILAFILILPSCNKIDLKKPTSVNVKFDISTATQQTNSIVIKDSELTLQNFNISGERIEGEGIDFTRELSEPLIIDLDGETLVDELYFDLPQGEYTELIVEFENIEGNEESSLTILGKYKLSFGPNVDVIFELEEEQLFTLYCEDLNQSDLLVLYKNIEQTISIELDVIYWLNSITDTDLDNATITPGNNGNGLGNSTIFINQTNNVSLYNKVVNRITQGNKAILK